MPEALREKLEPAFGYTEQVTCNPIVKDEHPNPSRLLQRLLQRAQRFTARGPLRQPTPRSVRRCLPDGTAVVLLPLRFLLHSRCHRALRTAASRLQLKATRPGAA